MRRGPWLQVLGDYAGVLVPCALITLGWSILVAVGALVFTDPDWPRHRAAAAASLTLLAAALAVLLLVPERVRLPIAALVLLGTTVVGWLDLLAWRHYQDMLSIGDWHSLGNLPLLADSIWVHTRPADVWLVLPAATAIAALTRRGTRHNPIGWRPRMAAAFSLGLLTVTASIPVARLVTDDPSRVFEFAFQRREIVSSVGLPAYHVYDVLEYVALRAGRSRVRATIDLSAVADQLVTRAARGPFRGLAAGANLIVISLESFQQFVIDLQIEGQEVAPRLSALARESLQFTRVIDQTHRGTTADAEWLAFQSLHPLGAGAVATRRPTLELHGLPALLARHGYDTTSAAAEPPSHWNMGSFRRRVGFGRSWFLDSFPPMRWMGAGGADAPFFEELGRRLARLVEPYFLFALTSSSHHPFDLPQSERRLRLGALEGTALGSYLQAVNYADRALGAFLDALHESGHARRTLLVVYGDHSAALDMAAGELAVALSTSPHLATADPTFRAWWTRTRVPLLIRLPAAASAGEFHVPAGLLDLTPTVLGLLGLGTGAGPWLGRDLLSDDPLRQVIARDGTLADIAGVALPVPDRGRCYTWSGRAIPCERFEPVRRAAAETFRLSDALIDGDLIKDVAEAAARADRQRPTRNDPVLVIAHRGASQARPENTALAVTAAFDAGADVVELDLRLTRDGHVVVFHDDGLDRIARRPGRVEDLRLDEFLSLDVGSWFSKEYAGISPLTLDAALPLAMGRGGLLLDLKAEGLGPGVAAAITRAGFPPRTLLIGAWTATQRQEFRRLVPGARLLKTQAPPSDGTTPHWDLARAEGAWGWEFEASTPRHVIETLARSGLVPIAYTVNDEAHMRELIAAGVGGIETDDPGLLRRVVDELRVGTRPGDVLSGRW